MHAASSEQGLALMHSDFNHGRLMELGVVRTADLICEGGRSAAVRLSAGAQAITRPLEDHLYQ